MVTKEIGKLRKEKFNKEVVSYLNFAITVFLLLIDILFIVAKIVINFGDGFTLFLGIILCFAVAGSFMNGMRQFRKLLAIEDRLEKLEKAATEVEHKPEPVSN